MLVCLSFLSSLQDIFAKIFEEVFAPILEVIFTALFELLTGLLEELFADILLQLMVILLKILDFLEDIFDIFSGVRYVLYYPNGRTDFSQLWKLDVSQIFSNGTVVPAGSMVNYKQTYLIDYFTLDGPLRDTFLLLTLLGVALAFIFTIIRVAKSVHDGVLGGGRSVGQVLTSAMKTAFTFMLVPVMVLFLCKLSTVLVYQLDKYVGGSAGNTSAADMLFLVSTMGDDSKIAQPSFDDTQRAPYLTGERKYSDVERVKKDFDYSKFDYFTAILCILGSLLIMVLSLFVVIKRLFEIAILYVISPIFVSTMPLDDGQIFGKWRDRFIGSVFSGFGTVMALEIFLIFVPVICSASLKLSDNANIDIIIRVFIILGGLYAAYKSTELLLQILSPDVAQGNSVLGMAAVAALTGGIGAVAKVAAGGLISGRNSGKQKALARRAGRTQQVREQPSASGGGSEQSGQAFSGGKSPDTTLKK